MQKQKPTKKIWSQMRFAKGNALKGVKPTVNIWLLCAARARGMFCTEFVNLLIFSFGDALFPKDILAPALIWHSRLMCVEPTKTQRSNTQLCVFCFIAYLLIISFSLPTFKLIFSYGGKRPPAGDLIG